MCGSCGSSTPLCSYEISDVLELSYISPETSAPPPPPFTLCIVTHVSLSSGLRVRHLDSTSRWIPWYEFCPLNVAKTMQIYRVDEKLWTGRPVNEDDEEELIVGEGWAKQAVALKK
ncbi:hypothetical protein TrVE_jg7244 [Triparma verrucosa]|uniref:Uncharacterized protein n=2 Tax=Triparma TaxID=722752 RepID=A0A9W7ETU3_9STRA|nr:hypothetical protein TrST_g5311 [Triparma strigata]GMH98828.1 hypothetical protein TrVE_jg7244 [Triparma verrucosa]